MGTGLRKASMTARLLPEEAVSTTEHLLLTVEEAAPILGMTGQALAARIRRKQWTIGLKYIGVSPRLSWPAIRAWLESPESNAATLPVAGSHP
jgi:hypothetical protein